MLWLGDKDIGDELGVQNIYEHFFISYDKEIKGKCETKNPMKQQIRKYKRHSSKLIDGEKFVCTHEDIIMSIIMSCRVSTP